MTPKVCLAQRANLAGSPPACAHARGLPPKCLQENIDLQSTILSRFDLIFIVKDERSAARDMQAREPACWCCHPCYSVCCTGRRRRLCCSTRQCLLHAPCICRPNKPPVLMPCCLLPLSADCQACAGCASVGGRAARGGRGRKAGGHICSWCPFWFGRHSQLHGSCRGLLEVASIRDGVGCLLPSRRPSRPPRWRHSLAMPYRSRPLTFSDTEPTGPRMPR